MALPASFDWVRSLPFPPSHFEAIDADWRLCCIHLYYLERAAELQVKAMSCNRNLRLVPHEVAQSTARQFARERERWARLHLDALRRKLDHEHPEYAS